MLRSVGDTYEFIDAIDEGYRHSDRPLEDGYEIGTVMNLSLEKKKKRKELL
jgi:hypothetical protein